MEMVRVKVSEATGPLLNWLVATCEGLPVGVSTQEEQAATFLRATPEGPARDELMRVVFPVLRAELCKVHPDGYKCRLEARDWNFTESWAAGGPIVDKLMLEGLVLRCWKERGICQASLDFPRRFSNGPTTLVAAMRCYVVSRLGDEVQAPACLLTPDQPGAHQAAQGMRRPQGVRTPSDQGSQTSPRHITGPASNYTPGDHLTPDVDVIEGDVVLWEGAVWMAKVKRGATVPLLPIVDGRPVVSFEVTRKVDLREAVVVHTGANVYGYGGQLLLAEWLDGQAHDGTVVRERAR